MTTKTETVFHTVMAPRVITEDRMRCLLCSAFEGGSDWVCNADGEFRDGLTIDDFRTDPDDYSKQGSEAAKLTPGDYWPWHMVAPFAEGCALILEDTEEKNAEGNPVKYRLDRAAMIRGLDLMAEKYPRHFNDFVEEDDDAITADVWLQLASLGELVYS